MYKKLLFLLIALPLTHSTIYSMDRDAETKVPLSPQPPALQLTPLGFFFSHVNPVNIGALVTIGVCAKEKSVDKEIIVPIAVAAFLGHAVSMVSSKAFSLGNILTKKDSRLKTVCETFITNNVNLPLGYLALLYCYYKNR